MTTLLWFRNDLRLTDNPALHAAMAGDAAIVPVYIHAPAEENAWSPGGAAQWWLHHALQRLAEELEAAGSRLCIRDSTNSLATLRELVQECGATRAVWNRRYEPAIIERDQHIKTALRADGVQTDSFNGALLHEPWTVQTKSGGPFQVFTPFWRHCKGLAEPPEPLARPRTLAAPRHWPGSVSIESLALLPRVDWAGGLRATWQPGSRFAHARLKDFLDGALDEYSHARDRPGIHGTSRMSPYLHHGNISAREIWHATRRHALARGRHTTWRDSQFLTELGWREFAHHLLYHFPHVPEQPLRENFARFPWKDDARALEHWQRGTTGYPIVDAGMRELWHTGWMHNRVRMIVASFLVKDLLLPWTAGERWFWDTLVDADLANNAMGWQWVAGCGADAAPYFRIFNPVSQGMRFDADASYVRRWVPELKELPDDVIHQPWKATAEQLARAKVRLGHDYPAPLVDHAQARGAALSALSTLKSPPKK